MPVAAEPVAAAAVSTAVDNGPLSTTVAPTTGQRVVELRVGPLTDMAVADNLAELFKEITDLGTIEAMPDHASLANVRRFKVTTSTAESELLDLFTFHVAREQVAFFSLDAAPAAAAKPAAPAAPAADGTTTH